MNASRSVVGSQLLKHFREGFFVKNENSFLTNTPQELNWRNIWEKQQWKVEWHDGERRSSSCLFCCFSIIHRTSLYRFFIFEIIFFVIVIKFYLSTYFTVVIMVLKVIKNFVILSLNRLFRSRVHALKMCVQNFPPIILTFF